MIRSLIALGFNEDEQGRRVFDGAYPHIGGGLMPLNVRFGQPVRAWGEQTDHLYPAYDFPFSYARQFDPLTGRTQGLFDRCMATNTCPRIFHVATALEMWEGRQSLGLTDPLGRWDVRDPPNVRTFIMASTQHGPASLPLRTEPPFGNCQQQPNPDPQLWTMRALLNADGLGVGTMRRHPERHAAHSRRHDRRARPGAVSGDTRERLSRRPAAGDVAVRACTTRCTCWISAALPAGDTSGVITREPPHVRTASYGVLAPQVDADGNDIAGIRSVFVQVPIGTYTGWNFGRKDRFEGGMCNLQGSFIPFAANPRRAPRRRRSAAFDRGALSVQGSLCRRVQEGGGRSGRPALSLARRAKRLIGRAESEGIRTAP